MQSTTGQAEKLSAAETADQADALYLSLHHLTEIIKVTAFAAESRRVLSALTSDIREDIGRVVTSSNEWIEMEDSTGHVLKFVARELERINNTYYQTGFCNPMVITAQTTEFGRARA